MSKPRNEERREGSKTQFSYLSNYPYYFEITQQFLAADHATKKTPCNLVLPTYGIMYIIDRLEWIFWLRKRRAFVKLN